MQFNLRLLIPLLIIINVLLLALYLKGTQNKSFPEIQELEGKNLSFQELKTYFTDLANKKGAEYAYEVLKVAPIPPNTDMHLMGHVVGDVLYREQGINGIKICTEDFRNACSHSIVVGLLLDKGEEVLPDIASACRKAPGGTGAYTMCYHGLGHGVLAYTNYDLPKAVELCQKTGQAEGIQCIGGTIMEIISGGDHDKTLWGRERPKYLKADDTFYPCMAGFMPKDARGMCLTYLTPYLWEAVGANIGNPSDLDFEKSFALCASLDNQYQKVCYGGFGKEFVGLAASRDIRAVEQMGNEQLTQVYKWCQMAEAKDGIKECIHHALSSLFWGGENDRGASIRFCTLILDEGLQQSCFTDLIGQVNTYINDPSYKKSFCQEIPNDLKSQCQTQLL